MKLALLALCTALVVWSQTPSDNEHVIPSLDGQTLFVTYCAVCHGKAADGTGPMASVLKVRVANLTHIAKRHGGQFPFEEVSRRIEGSESSGSRKPSGESPGTR